MDNLPTLKRMCSCVCVIEESEWGGVLGVADGEFPHNLSNPLKHPILYSESLHIPNNHSFVLY